MHDSKHKSLFASVFGILVAVGAVFLYVSLFGALQKQAELEQFTIPTTTAADHDKKIIDDSREIAELLKEKGFIKSTLGFSIAFSGRISSRCVDCIAPGAYKISKSMNVFEVARVLKSGPYMKWVVIPEGLRKEQIAELIGDTLGWTGQQKSSWVNTYTSMTFDEVEGVYFPDTYLIPVDEGLEAVANRLRAKFNEKFAPYLKEANKQNIKWTTLLKIASLVQREAAGKDDMPLIAGILWNRLLQNMKLDIDATIQYARGDVGEGWWAPITVEDKQIDSPYNTYLYKGLPPHPIANPGIAAIEAVLFPEETDCFYYLHDADGNIYCSADYEEHQENIERYLR
ncbi:MAG: endolytic transglycosylase MltG [Patescibacteria group bacterium]|nr:endolytic transglycosylase MltG [Patescibacteria group bacterium]